jgi:hypothetical protein
MENNEFETFFQKKYETPKITTYTEEEIAGIIGPAQTYVSGWEYELG